MIPLRESRREERYRGASISELLVSGPDLFDLQADYAVVSRTAVLRTPASDL
jgi:hypothetical protein